MKHLMFIGATDKSDFILYLCKLLAAAGKKVLLNDVTIDQWASYYLGAWEDPIVEFEGFDILHNEEKVSLQKFINEYDIIITDTDHEDYVTFDDFKAADKRYVVTTYEKSIMDKNQQILEKIYSTVEIANQLEIDRIILSSVECSVDEEYMNLLYEDKLIIWPEESINIPVDEVNFRIKVDNQHNHRLSMKGISRQLKRALIQVCKDTLECDQKAVKVIWKSAMRRS